MRHIEGSIAGQAMLWFKWDVTSKKDMETLVAILVVL
jgi:hypothetical protein